MSGTCRCADGIGSVNRLVVSRPAGCGAAEVCVREGIEGTGGGRGWSASSFFATALERLYRAMLLVLEKGASCSASGTGGAGSVLVGCVWCRTDLYLEYFGGDEVASWSPDMVAVTICC